jgi:hypothetical protein
MTRRLAVWARATAPAGRAEAVGRRGPRLVLVGCKEAAPGLAEALLAAGLEPAPRLAGIERAVEWLAHGHGHADGQPTGGLVSCGTSSAHRRLHAGEGGAGTRAALGGLREVWYTKAMCCHHTIESDALPPVARVWVGPDARGIQRPGDAMVGRRRTGRSGSKPTVVRHEVSLGDQGRPGGWDRAGPGARPPLGCFPHDVVRRGSMHQQSAWRGGAGDHFSWEWRGVAAVVGGSRAMARGGGWRWLASLACPRARDRPPASLCRGARSRA